MVTKELEAYKKSIIATFNAGAGFANGRLTLSQYDVIQMAESDAGRNVLMAVEKAVEGGKDEIIQRALMEG